MDDVENQMKSRVDQAVLKLQAQFSDRLINIDAKIPAIQNERIIFDESKYETIHLAFENFIADQELKWESY